MKFRLIAVGHKMPAWINAGFDEYAKRMPRTLRIELVEIKPASRPANAGIAAVEQWKAEEAERIRAVLPKAGIYVVLDERGELPTTAALAKNIERWQQDGRDVAFVIGGADGLDTGLRARADDVIALSKFTLPHGLCRVLLAEQLYRAVSLLQNHPYHRE